MKNLFFALLMIAGSTSFAQINTLAPGAMAPEIRLRNVNNKELGFESMPGSKGYIVVFTCNTCPVAKAYEQRIIALNEKFAPMGYPVVAVNANDPSVSNGDSFEDMQSRAKDKNYRFPYLFDEDQRVTNAYGARNTPHIFLVNKTNGGNVIAYTGAIDNDPENEKSNKVNYLEQAIMAIKEGKSPTPASTKAIGCGIKRKRS